MSSEGAHSPKRDYAAMVAALHDDMARDLDQETRMSRVVDILWDHLSDNGVSWAGFYLIGPDREHMLLGPRRNKPACSPIGMHGACGRCFLDAAALVVRDVQDLGADYIACDPRDRSEVVLPIYDRTDEPIGVLDLDSFDVGSFDDHDVAGLTRVLTAAGFTKGPKSD